MGDTWQDRCKARGGFPTLGPIGHEREGEPVCRFGTPGVDLVYQDARLTFAESLGRSLDNLVIAKDRALGQVVEARDAVLEATGASAGVLGVVSKLIGLPRPVVVLLGLSVGYLLLRNAGVLRDPLGKS
jgi:hypothetical protein